MALILATAITIPMALPVTAEEVDPPGIVGLWHFDGNAGDSSGSGNHGVRVGTPLPGLSPGRTPPVRFPC